ncbi:MAG: hypothetical protein JWN04_5937 [Myxococcaceae bacterium]|nr:hypothetical protein [Myxococcaceae bacterium]
MPRRSEAELKKAEGRALTHLARVLKVKNAIKDQQRRDDVRRKILIGSAAIEMMRKDAALRERCQAALDTYLDTRPKEAGLFAANAATDYVALLCEPQRLAELRRPAAPEEDRKSISQRAADLRRAQDQEAADDTRRKIILGGTFLTFLRADPSLRTRITVALKEGFTAKAADAELFALGTPRSYIERLALAEAPASSASLEREPRSGSSVRVAAQAAGRDGKPPAPNAVVPARATPSHGNEKAAGSAVAAVTATGAAS